CFAPDPYAEFGQCAHKIARHENAPGRLYMQNHGGWADWTGPGGPRPDIGVLRSDDYGHSWRSIAKGLPSDFGFPIVVHPHDADTVYVMPLEPATRSCPGGAPAVWRSENGGESWRSEEHTSELQSHLNLVCRLLLEKKKKRHHS